jgi:hypothetical protein
MNRLAPLLALLALLPAAAVAAPPAGQSALLNGMHDIESLSFMTSATSGCDKGWITDLQYIGTSGTPSADCHASATSAGVSIIQRLDASSSEAVPKSTSQSAGYGAAFAAFVAQCSKIHVWIVGNEPNQFYGKSDPDCTADLYATAYVEVHKKVHALSGHAQDLVLATANSPYSPGCLQSSRMIIDRIEAKGITPDGFALHVYTQVSTGSSLTSSAVSDTKTVSDTTTDECSGGATWSDTWYWNFYIYRDYLKVIEGRGLAGKPVFITESGNACTASSGNACYPNANVGYFQALYAEVASHNKGSSSTKIRAVTPYRWTTNDDGTGRDFSIGNRSTLQADLKQAFAKGYAWTTPASCTGPTTDGGSPVQSDSGAGSADGSVGGDLPGVGEGLPGGGAGVAGSGCGCTVGDGGRGRGGHAAVLVIAILLGLRVRSRITRSLRPPIHPGWRRCSSVTFRGVCALLSPCQPGASSTSVDRFILERTLSGSRTRTRTRTSAGTSASTSTSTIPITRSGE